jgi:hypothetical protein
VHFLHKNEQEAGEVERELMNPSFVCSSFAAKPIMSSAKAYSAAGERGTCNAICYGEMFKTCV